MIEHRRVYYYFLLGVAGSVTGWYLAELCTNAFISLAQNAVLGALLGGLIGMAIACYDGITTRSFFRFLRFGGTGLVIGGVAGALALVLVQLLYTMMRGQNPDTEIPALQSISAGLTCWLLLGSMIGLGAVINKGTQIYKGAIGGLIGAVFGGLIYEVARINHSEKSSLTKALSLGLLGGAIGASVALITTAQKRAWFEVENGPLRGRTYDVTKYVDVRIGSKTAGLIGSDANAVWVYLPGDPGVLPRHAKIHYAGGAPMLTVFEDGKGANKPTLVNGRPITASSPLSDDDCVQIGNTTLIYHQKVDNKISQN